MKKAKILLVEKSPIVAQGLTAILNEGTGFEVAAEAFEFHRSQVRRNWQFEAVGPHDNTLFGLYFTKVGQDTGIGDFMENIQ